MNAKNIENAILQVTGLELKDYSTPDRTRHLVFARMIFSALCIKHKIKPEKHINRHRATVLYYRDKYLDEKKYNKEFNIMATQVEEILNDEKI